MIDDWLLSLIYTAWLTATTMPLGFMLGASCSPCCSCGVGDNKPRTDPKDEGTWVPSGTWRGAGGVTWTFTANPGDDSGETWFFYGSGSTSKAGGVATLDEQQDWGNICNWYSNKTTSPSTSSGLPSAFNKRATRLPPANAVVHVYTSVSTANVGPQTVKNIFFWQNFTTLLAGSEITATASAHDSAGGAVFNNNLGGNAGTVNGGATFNDDSRNTGTVNGGAIFNHSGGNSSGTINGGATFYDSASNTGTVNGGAVFNDFVRNSSGTINGGATFNGTSRNESVAIVNGGAIFNDSSVNIQTIGGRPTVNDGATFNGSSRNDNGTVNDGATFNDSSENRNGGIVNGGATFNGNSSNRSGGIVNGGATFNDAACTTTFVGNFFATPCSRKFVAHPTDLPVCNGTAVNGCNNALDTCGCG